MALSRIFVAPKNGQGGVKKSKKIFFSEKIFERWEKKFGDLWDHNFIFRKSPDAFRTLTLPPPTRFGPSHGHVPNLYIKVRQLRHF